MFKRQWAGLLFTEGVAGLPASLSPAERERLQAQAAQGGAAQARVAQEIQCGRFLPQVCAAYQQAATLGRATPQMISLLEASSPASVAGRIDVPTLLIQGENDSLFGLDQANANYQAIKRNGAPVDMVWFAGGHDGGNQEASRLTDLTQAWFDRWLMPRGRPWRPGSRPAASARPGQPAFAVTRVRGFDPATDEQVLDVATAPAYPGLNGTRRTQVSLSGPAQPVVNPAGGAPPSISVFPGASPGAAGDSGISGGGLAFDVPGQSAFFQSAPLRAPLQVTGSMTVRIRVAGTAQVTLFAKVYDVDQAGNATLPFSLAAPLRVTNAGSGRVVTVTLPAIDYQFAAGHRLRLALTATDFAYATPTAPATYLVALAGRGLTVPSDPALAVSGTGVPWWTWAAPAAALLASALILITGRRRARGWATPAPPGRGPAGDHRADQALPRRPASGGRPVATGRARADPGPARAERSGQDHHPARAHGPAASRRGHDNDLRPSGPRRVRGAVPAGRVRGGTGLPAAPVGPGQPRDVLARRRADRRPMRTPRR